MFKALHLSSLVQTLLEGFQNGIHKFVKLLLSIYLHFYPSLFGFQSIYQLHCTSKQRPSHTFLTAHIRNLEAQTRNEIARLEGNKDLEAIMDFLDVDEL